MVGCQNYDSFFGHPNIRCRIKIGIQKGTIILKTTHITAFLFGPSQISGPLQRQASNLKDLHNPPSLYVGYIWSPKSRTPTCSKCIPCRYLEPLPVVSVLFFPLGTEAIMAWLLLLQPQDLPSWTEILLILKILHDLAILYYSTMIPKV